MSPVPASEVKHGDVVKVQFKVDDDFFTIEGKAYADISNGDLIVAGWVIAHANGNPGPYSFCVVERTPAQPPVGTILEDGDRNYWVRLPDGWVDIAEYCDRSPWSYIANCSDLKEVTT